TYNLVGELVSETSSLNASTLDYSYDKSGALLSASLGGTAMYTNTYDSAGRLTRTRPGPTRSNDFDFGYDAASRRTTLKTRAGTSGETVTTYIPDALSR